MSTLILQGPQLTLGRAYQFAQQLGSHFQPQEKYYRLDSPRPFSLPALAALRATCDFDINLLPENYHPEQVRLLITDMDSTFINIECANEIAAYAGKETEVSMITAAAMRGEIDFETSLIQRMKLLEGVPATALDDIYENRLRVNQGGNRLLTGLKQRDIKVALVSGGFTYFTDHLKQEYNLDYALANRLELKKNRLTGTVAGNIVGASAKAKYLLMLCEELAIEPWQVIAVGDGANDLEMLRIAGLGIAYHAKPKVQAEARIVLNHSALDGILAFL